MSLIYNRYQGRWSPSGCLTVDAPNMVTAIKMLTKNKGSEPIHVLLLEEGIYVANALPQGSFTVSVLGIDPLDGPNTGNNGTNAANIGWKLGNSSVLTPYSIDGESVTESTPSSNINTNQDIVGTVYPMSGTLPLGNTVILNAVPSVTGAYLFSHFTVSNPNVNGGSEEVYSIDNGKVHKVIDGDYVSYAIQFNIADGMTKVKAIFTKNPDYIDPETVIDYRTYYMIEDEEGGTFTDIGYLIGNVKYDNKPELTTEGRITVTYDTNNPENTNPTHVLEVSHSDNIITEWVVNRIEGDTELTDVTPDYYTEIANAPKVYLDKYSYVTFKYNKDEDKEPVSKWLKYGSHLDTSTSMDISVGEWWHLTKCEDNDKGMILEYQKINDISEWTVPYENVTLYNYDPTPIINYHINYYDVSKGNVLLGYQSKSELYYSDLIYEKPENPITLIDPDNPESTINIDIVGDSSEGLRTNEVTIIDPNVLTNMADNAYTGENAPIKVYLEKYTKVSFQYNKIDDLGDVVIDTDNIVSKVLKCGSAIDTSTTMDIPTGSWYRGDVEGTDEESGEPIIKYIEIDFNGWTVPYNDITLYGPNDPTPKDPIEPTEPDNTEGGEPNAD